MPKIRRYREFFKSGDKFAAAYFLNKRKSASKFSLEQRLLLG